MGSGQSSTKGTTTNMSTSIQQTIQKHGVVIYSKSYCPYCTAAKRLFADVPSVEIIELDKRKDGNDIQSSLLDLTGQRTVPNVFIGGKHVGGNDDCQRLAKNGKLNEMLAKL